MSSGGAQNLCPAKRGNLIKRVEGTIGRPEQLVDDDALAGLDGHGQGREAGGLLAPLLPASGGMGKVELGHDLADGVQDDDVVVLLRPIKTGEVGERRFRGRHEGFPVRGSGGGSRSFRLAFGP